ncbi:MAG: hypothetical protein JOZ65_34055 [Chloroflexi bacterium]|nr:hypothetical protein [Chloroflexota bacterium]
MRASEPNRTNFISVRSEVAGRIRWDVDGLKGAPRRAAALATALQRAVGVTHVIANPLTGRLPVEFDPGTSQPGGLEQIIQTVIALPYRDLAIPSTDGALQVGQ